MFLYYYLDFKGKPIILKSKLGLKVANGDSFRKDLVKDYKTSAFKEDWNPVMGETKTINNHYNQLRVILAQPFIAAREIAITFRLYDYGLVSGMSFPNRLISIIS